MDDLRLRPDKVPPTRERPLFLDLILIGAVIAILMYGGLLLLGRTHAAWEQRNTERNTRASTIRAAAESGQTQTRQRPAARKWTANDDAEYFRLKAQAEERRRRYEATRPKNTRCIDGTLFRVEGSSYTNIGRC